MKPVFSILVFIVLLSPATIFDFSTDSDMSRWRVVDDGVMGGRSAGSFALNEDGHAVFSGRVSLENNGGFSSVRYRFRSGDISSYTKIVMHVRGDGKKYQLRLKEQARDYHSYATSFDTNGAWQVIEIPFEQFYPQFRGRLLNMPDFAGIQIEELGILVGNKKAEAFRLEIDKIELL